MYRIPEYSKTTLRCQKGLNYSNRNLARVPYFGIFRRTKNKIKCSIRNARSLLEGFFMSHTYCSDSHKEFSYTTVKYVRVVTETKWISVIVNEDYIYI